MYIFLSSSSMLLSCVILNAMLKNGYLLMCKTRLSVIIGCITTCCVFKRGCLGLLEVYFVIMVTDPIWFEHPVVEPEDSDSYSHQAAGWTSWFDSWQRQRLYHFCSTFISAKSPILLRIQYILEAPSSGGKRPAVVLSTHCHLLSRLR
jgi:hypothetical protein